MVPFIFIMKDLNLKTREWDHIITCCNGNYTTDSVKVYLNCVNDTGVEKMISNGKHININGSSAFEYVCKLKYLYQNYV